MTLPLDVASTLDGGIDLDPTFAAVVDARRALAFAVLRRFVTPAGSLPWDPAAGYDLTALFGESFTSARLLDVQGAVEAEAVKERGVAAAAAVVRFDAKSRMLLIALTLTIVEGSPLPLTLEATPNGVALLP